MRGTRAAAPVAPPNSLLNLPTLQSRFPRISAYGFISDCHTGALIAPNGSAEWLCLPRFDDPSAFGSLLDRSAGFWRIGPPGLGAPVSRRYVPGTNVLETGVGHRP